MALSRECPRVQRQLPHHSETIGRCQRPLIVRLGARFVGEGPKDPSGDARSCRHTAL